MYARVEVEDHDLYTGPGADHMYDSVEFFVGPGSSGSNQWRVSSTGVLSGQSHTDRAAWTDTTDTGYILEVRIPKRDLDLQVESRLTFEVGINNSTEKGGDRYEVVTAFGEPDAGFWSDASFRDSVLLVSAEEADERFSVTVTTGPGGTVTPNPPGNVLRVDPGSILEFEIEPDAGKVVDAVTVDGEAVAVSPDNKFVLEVTDNHRIHVTFKDDAGAEPLSFIVWNDNFARGEYTAAVIIDLGEGREASGADLHPGLFKVSARDTTLTGNTVVFDGERTIARVYANDEPKVRGYLGKIEHSPDYREGLESGRYIVVELEFYTEVGGRTTLDENSNSTKQNYSIVLLDEIVLTEGDPISRAVFRQTDVVNPILDRFTTHSNESKTFHYALYIHKDEEGHEVHGLPLYVYTHGFSRGGTQPDIDQKASMKSANGSVAIMKKMEEDPEKYASHILNISYAGFNTPDPEDVKAVIDEMIENGLVDPNRIYVSGFSMGGGYTHRLVNTYPGFFAAAAPMGVASGWPLASENEAHKDLAYWIFVNQYDNDADNLDNFESEIVHFNNARASRFESNEALSWPYIQYDQPSQRPPMPTYTAHEIEAAVLYNRITMENPHTREIWSIAPIMQSPGLPEWNDDYTDVFDWMFSQRKPGVPDAPGNLTAAAGNRQVTLKWTAPAYDGGKEILGYKVWHGDEAPVTVTASVYEYTFTGLTNGQEYTFHVVAFNEIGDSAPASVKATPRSSSSGGGAPGGGGGGGGGSDTTGDTGAEPEDETSQPDYTLITPEDQPAVTDEDGNTTLPGGGEIALADGTRIEVPAGTTIDADGKVTVGSGGATVRFANGFTLGVRGGALLILDGEPPLGFTVASGHPFRDVREDAWYAGFVNTVYAFGLFDGTSVVTFSPGIPMTRAMFVQVLANLENIDRSGYEESRFLDVPDGQWYTAAVEWAAENGIVSGISEDLFDPHAPVTREQMAVILYNYLNAKGYRIPSDEARPFADESEISPWALEAVNALRGIGILSGKGDNIFDPKATATRAEIATVFVKLIEYLVRENA